jgi:hypothetical protein
MSTTKLTTRQRDKLIEAAQNAIEFTVEGNGRFPTDMLRYDRCWPASEKDSNLISFTNDLQVFDIGIETYRKNRKITLKGLIGPTIARWASFGWAVVEGP